MNTVINTIMKDIQRCVLMVILVGLVISGGLGLILWDRLLVEVRYVHGLTTTFAWRGYSKSDEPGGYKHQTIQVSCAYYLNK